MKPRKWRRPAPPTAPAVVMEKAAPTAPPKRKRDPQKLLAIFRGLLLGVVVLAPEVAAWHSLTEVAQSRLGLTDSWRFLVPLVFGAAASYVALLAQRYVLRGDSAITERALTWIYAGAGAALSFWFYQNQGRLEAALFFGGASLSAVLLWDRTLRAWRRDQLREVGALEQPLPRFRFLRWVLAPPSTFLAFRLSVLYGLTTPSEALAKLEEVQAARKATTEKSKDEGALTQVDESTIDRSRPAPEQQPDEPEEPIAEGTNDDAPGHALALVEKRRTLAEVAKTSKAQAVREAWRMNGVDGLPGNEDVAPAVELLAKHGVEVDPKYVRLVRLRDKAALESKTEEIPQLTAVGGA